MTALSVDARQTIHATSIVVGQTGLLFLGSSGSGKSGMAFSCMAEAWALGWHAALIADDRTCLAVHGDHCIASCPEPIRGMMELRGTGIVAVRRIARALIHCAISLGEPSAASRVPPEHETFSCNGASMPLLRLWHDGAGSPLARIRAARPQLFSGC